MEMCGGGPFWNGLHRLMLAVLTVLVVLPPLAQADLLARVHFLIPAGPGGGWDGTARGTGEALLKSGLVADVSFENLSGGGGGRAIAKLIETADRQPFTLMISSTPMVVRSLQGIFPQSFRDLEPIASVIADYGCFAVRSDSDIRDFSDVVERIRENPRSVKVAGGSVKGSTDHFVFAKAVAHANINPRRTVYVAYDGGGKAMAGLLTGETQLLSTGLSEAIDMARQGEIRIIAITASERLQDAPELPTLTEQGFPVEFANWRGFFAAPGLSPDRYRDMRDTLRDVVSTEAFEKVRVRNQWTRLYHEGPEFTAFLVEQERDIGKLMRDLGFLR
ncbi:MAG: tripartite tricarboxylate transporter substrate-binding protein [Gammaproteobacteria bacterium]|nr:tripartite tricarboxylate transporter substrate-binding protein [Gammaproteobacteria bacterium]RPG25734.1 MAG: tripartite tricarboxylate transporter substrate binding protein [Gammaproteobacteria bacterium TMED50]